MPTIGRLRTIARRVTPYALDVYDREDPKTILPMLARVVSRRDVVISKGQIEWEWWAAFPEMLEWIGERTTQELFADSMKVPIRKYHITYEMDRDTLDGDGALASATGLAKTIGEGFAVGKVDRAYLPIVQNRPAYDGQDLIDVDHVHPNGSTYSNKLVLGADLTARADVAAPTVQEARTEFKIAIRTLQKNHLVRHTLRRFDTTIKNYVVIVHSDGVLSAYSDLLVDEKINVGGGIEPNRFRNQFELLHYPTETPDHSVDFIYARPGGPRPVVFVKVKEPRGVEFDTKKLFGSAAIPFGMDARYAWGTAFPQTVLRVTP